MVASSINDCDLMVQMTKLQIDNVAVLKLLLHSVKFPSCSVNGVFIGETEGETLHITDAIPLFHTILTIAPPLEIALSLIEEKLKQKDNEKMKIVGMYVADAYLSKAEFDNASKTLADKIANLTSTHITCAFILEGETFKDMIKGEDMCPFKVFTKKKNERNWEAFDKTELKMNEVGSIRSLLEDMIERRVYTKIYDFDEHLDDIKKDFFNTDVV